MIIFSSPVQKYRKSYCNHPGVVVGVRFAQMLKFLVKVFVSVYLLNMLMDQVDTVLIRLKFYTILSGPTLGDLEVKDLDLEILC